MRAPCTPSRVSSSLTSNNANTNLGAGGGIVSMAITYPLIAVSTRMAIQRNDKHKNAYRGFLDAFTKILRTEGPAGFYAYAVHHCANLTISGLHSALFGIALTNGIYYYWYETINSILLRPGKRLKAWENLIAGAAAGTPLVRTR